MTEQNQQTKNQDQTPKHGVRTPYIEPDPDPIRIYVACLAAYNNGQLHGAWIDVEDEDTIREEVQTILKSSPIADAEEWGIHDHEGFEGAEIGEYTGFARVVELAEFIRNCDGFGGKLLSHFNEDIEDAEKALENYSGEHASLADYAESLTDESTEIPENLRLYIDYEKMGRDMELGGDVFTIETGYKEIHIFWCH
ncbi:MAG: antirestriction protein [Robiginitomaculum sp.]|nr:MAG: antirestriction protein [Robiginitomaculum sp.]